MALLYSKELNRLCSSSETYEKAQSILRLVTAKTCPGSGFVIKKPTAIPAVCVYLASEQLNTGEVSFQSAAHAACVTQAEFTVMLNKIRTALCTEAGNVSANVAYETLVDAYHVYPRQDAIACMEDAEAALPHVHMIKEKYGANTLSCAIFYWVCQLMEEPSVQQRALCQAYSIRPQSFKAVLKTLDGQCDGIAEQIKSYLLLQRRSFAQASVSQPSHISEPTPISPQKSPVKSAMRLQRTTTATRKMSTPTTTPSKKRTVVLFSDGDAANGGGASFPETPTKRRRVDSSGLSPGKPATTSSSPAKRSSSAATAAFYAALGGSPAKQHAGQQSDFPGAGPSTPRRPRHANVTVTPGQAYAQRSPSRSQGQTLPTRPLVRHRFRPIFLEQQQWCARDPKVERMWAAADRVLGGMVELHGRPFHGGAVVSAA